MKKTVTLLTLIIVIFFSAFAVKIVYPWRSTTAIVKAGETFEVWFSADAEQTVNSVTLRGPFSSTEVSIIDTKTDTWVYDQWSGNTCNRKYTVSVPVGTPSDRYDLVLKTSSGDEISLAGVKVVKEFKTNFYVMHFSDAHRWQGTYDTPNIILREISTIIDIANIIDPEMLMETGDSHYQNTNSVSSSMQRINDYMNGFMNGTEYVKGLNSSFAPVFAIPGNHDTPQKTYDLEPGYPTPGYEKIPSMAFNDFYGLQAHNFTYGNVRFIGVNNSWFPDDGSGTPNFSHQTDAAKSWLNTVGKGSMRIGYCHVNTPQPIKAFSDPMKAVGAPLNLIIFGHCHSITNSPFTVDGLKIGYSTLTPRDGNNKVPFNLYKVDAVTGTYEAVGNEQAAQSGLEIAKNYTTAKLKLTYAKLNDGSNSTNTATIVNKFAFPISGARVRFVAPKETLYYVRNATIKQEFDGTNFHIIDATVNLDGNSSTVVELMTGIQIDQCPGDPNKMEPGLCGCGIPEGTCPVAVVNLTLPATARININTTRQLTPVFTPINASNKAITWDSSNPTAVSVNSYGKVSAISSGSAIITATSVDGAKQATTTVTVNPDAYVYPAEDAESLGVVAATEAVGFHGTGYMDYMNASTDYIKWTVYVPADDIYNLTFRYGLASGSRPLKLSVNDEVRIASTVFPATGAWTNWGNYTTSQALQEGVNTITLTAIGSSGGNFDELTIGGGTTSVSQLQFGKQEKSIKTYPNPFNHGKLSVDLIGFEQSKNVKINISNFLGQTVFQNTVHHPTHLNLELANTLNEESIYFISVVDGSIQLVDKLIIQ